MFFIFCYFVFILLVNVEWLLVYCSVIYNLGTVARAWNPGGV